MPGQPFSPDISVGAARFVHQQQDNKAGCTVIWLLLNLLQAAWVTEISAYILENSNWKPEA
jgi:hypothetical protein